MIIYYFIFILLIACYNIIKPDRCLANDKGKKDSRFVKLAGGLFIVLIGLRGTTVGSDTPQYAERYDNTLLRVARGFENPELGFDIIQFIFKQYLGIQYHGFLFIIAFFTIGTLFYMIYRYSKDELVSIFIFIMMLMAMYMSGIRQCTAMSCCFIAYVMAEKKKIIPFVILVIIAFFIHNSAIVCLFVYFIWKFRITRLQAFLLLIASISVFVLRPFIVPIIEILAPVKYEKMDLNDEYAINYLVLLVAVIMAAFALYAMPVKDESGIRKFSKVDSFFFILMCINLAFQIMSMSNNQLGRIGLYFILGYLIALPSALHNSERFSPSIVPIVRLIMITCFLAYFTIGAMGDVMEIDNYKFFWE